MGAACNEENGGANSADQRRASVQTRTDTFARAEARYPIPRTENFPLRDALVQFTERQDLLNHPVYVYIVADTGQIMGYYVAKTYPVNLCAFLSSTENVRDDDTGNLILTAPSLDGIYYGGAGASSSCDGWFFFDQASAALVEVIGFKVFIVDQPLNIEAQPLTVRG